MQACPQTKFQITFDSSTKDAIFRLLRLRSAQVAQLFVPQITQGDSFCLSFLFVPQITRIFADGLIIFLLYKEDFHPTAGADLQQIPNRTFDSSQIGLLILPRRMQIFRLLRLRSAQVAQLFTSYAEVQLFFSRIFGGFVLLILSFCPADYADFRRWICSKYLSFPRRTPIAANSPTAGADLQAVLNFSFPQTGGFVLLILSFCPADYADFRRWICSKYLSFPRRTPIAANSLTAGADFAPKPNSHDSSKDADISLTSATLSTGRSTFLFPRIFAEGFVLLILSFCPADYADFRRWICSKYLSFPRRTPIAANSLTAGANLQAVPTNQIPNRTFDSSTKDANIFLLPQTFLFPRIFAEGFALLILSFCPADYADFRRWICSKYLSFPQRTPIAANSLTAGADLQAVPLIFKISA